MNIIDRIKQKREKNLINDIGKGKANLKAIVKGFEKSNDKAYFISYCTFDKYNINEVKNAFKEKIQELSNNDKSFIANNLLGLTGSVLDMKEAKEIIGNQLNSEEIVSDMKLFEIYGYDSDKVELLQSVDTTLISAEIISSLGEKAQEDFLTSINHEDVTNEMINGADDKVKESVAQRFIEDSKSSYDTVTTLFSQDVLSNSIKNLVTQDATLLNDRTMMFISEENKSEVVTLAKMNYVLQRTGKENDDLRYPIQEMLNNDNFMKYFQYRQNNFNLQEGKEKDSYSSSSANRKIVLEVMQSINEYKNNSELIDGFLDSDKVNNEKIGLLLKDYISDKTVTKKITNLNELSEYPQDVLKRQMNEIALGNSDTCKDVIAKNLVGFSLEDYKTYNSMFLETHDLEDILKANNGNEEKISNIHVVGEIINLMDTMDENQLKEFATNIANRNYNELNSGDFSLVSLRENYKTFISNVKSEFGKDFNNSLGYNISNTENVQFNGKEINIHEISGEFKFLLHETVGNEILHSEKSGGKTCMSFISEGHYEVFKGNDMRTNSSAVFFLFDNVPEDLLYGSANVNIKSNFEGDKKSKFMTAENTILKAEAEQYSESDSKFTEQNYFYEGFDKDGKYVKIFPKAIGTFQEKPSEKTLQIAAQYGVDVIKIPDMQTNLENMLEDGLVTPGLIKGIDGNYDKVIDILSNKSSLSKEEKLSLKLVQQREGNEELTNQIEEILQKPTSKGKNEIEDLVDDINISQINAMSSKTRQVINMINNPEMNRGE